MGAGNVRACLVVDAVWLGTTVVALLALVPALGVSGAALAHVALVVPLTAAYAILAARHIGLRPGALWRAMRLPVVAVGGQAAVTALESWLVGWAGAPPPVADAVGALLGVVTLVGLLAVGEMPPHKELAAIARAVRTGRGSDAVVALEPAAPAAVAAGPAVSTDAGSALGRRLAGVALAVAATVAGGAAVQEPRFAVGLVLAGLAVLLAFRAPVAHLLALIALTTIVPLDVQARFGSGGDVAAAGVLPSDLLLVAGLARAVLVLPRRPLRRLASVAAGLTVLFLLAATLQLAHAMTLARPLSGAGGEFRALLGFGAILIALPILADAAPRRRLLAGLAGLGLALGLWGIVQFAAQLHFYDDPDSPIAAGSFLTAGRVIGLFAFPVAAIVALAVLTGAPNRRLGARALLGAVVVANCVAIVLTFERTFVVATLAGFALVFLRSVPGQRARLLAGGTVAVACTAVAVALVAPAAFSAYAARLASIGGATHDPAVLYRIEESRLVAQQIRARPVDGSALGATILIGRPGTNRALEPRRHAENAYLWLAWKFGIPAALVMCATLALALAAPGPAREERSDVVLRRGCQAALAAVMTASLTFSSFNQIGVTALMGLLAALCVAAPPQIRAARPRGLA